MAWVGTNVRPWSIRQLSIISVSNGSSRLMRSTDLLSCEVTSSLVRNAAELTGFKNRKSQRVPVTPCREKTTGKVQIECEECLRRGTTTARLMKSSVPSNRREVGRR